MITRYLEHFTQDEVDKSQKEILTKDLLYGGNRPYVIGTILRDPASGEYILWGDGNNGMHRLCIEHSPNELVEWKVVTENATGASIDLQQLTRDYPFGKIKRIGMIPLNAAPQGVPDDVYDVAYCMSTHPSFRVPENPDQKDYFTLSPTQCEFKVSQTTPLAQPTYFEIDALSYAPYFTDKVYFENIDILISVSGVVFYCVYELNDGVMYYPMSNAYEGGWDSGMKRPLVKIPFSLAHLTHVCVNNDDLVFPASYRTHLDISRVRFLGEHVSSLTLWSMIGEGSARNSYFNAEPANTELEYGSFVRLAYIIENFSDMYKGVSAYLRFTSDRYIS